MKTLIVSALLTLSAFAGTQVSAQSTTPQNSVSTETRFWVVSSNNGKIDVNVVKSEIKDVSISLIDNTGRILATSKVNKESAATRTRFDLTALPDGEYKVILNDGKTKETKTIELNTHDTEVVRTVSVA